MGKFLLVAFVSLVVSLSAFGAATQDELQSWYDHVSHTGNASTKDFLDATERQSLYRTVARHKVAALSQLSKYDNQKIGFCFGRAMTAHLAARKLELKADAIQKLFIIGDLRSGPDPEWRFHVTTLVKGEDGKRYAIDPVVGSVSGQARPFLLEDWIEIVRSTWDKNRKAHLYLTEGDTILPDMSVVSTHASFDTGDRIVELTFQPEGKAGFENVGFAHALDLIAQDKYLITTTEREGFDFLGFKMKILRLSGEVNLTLDYKGYFEDLLSDLKKPGPPELLPDDNRERVRALVTPRANLHGFGAGM